MPNTLDRPPYIRSLSATLLLLMAAFILLAEVLILVPFLSRAQNNYLEEKLLGAHLAAFALDATPNGAVDSNLENRLLQATGVLAISMHREGRPTLVVGNPNVPVAARYNVDDSGFFGSSISDAIGVMMRHEPRTVLIHGAPPDTTGEYLDVIISEGGLRRAMFSYVTRILNTSLVVALFSAGLVFPILHFIFVRPMRRITQSMAAFRAAPENAASTLPYTNRKDELGVAQRELRHMQEELRAALRQKSHLAALGTAVTKISHDLRNILATAQLVSDRLSGLRDPAIQPILPPLIRSIDRAISLCERTIKFGRADEPEPQRQRQALAPIVEEVRQSLGIEGDGRVAFLAEIPANIEIEADGEQILRALLNLVRNSYEAMSDADGGQILVKAHQQSDSVIIDVIDTGPGLPERARATLFQPFAASTRPGGSGLGLSIAREIIAAHGGDLQLRATGPGGTAFRIRLPLPLHRQHRSFA
jgi:signal transduction histidine kinase